MSLLTPEILTATVPQMLRSRAKIAPHRLALSAMSARGGRDRLSYAQLVHRMESVARGFAAAGIGPADRIAVFLDNAAGREAVLSALGALALGAVFVPVTTRASDADLHHIFDLVAPVAVVTDPSGARRLAGCAGNACFFILGGTCGTVWPEPEHQPAGPQPAAPADPDTLGCLLFTSGTTARPKAVMHTHRTMIAAGACAGQALGLTQRDLYQGIFPFFTSSAMNLACMSTWVHGAGFVMEGVIDTAARLDLVASEGTTFYHGVPSVVIFMLQAFDPVRHDLTGLRRVAYGGAAMPAQTIATIGVLWPWLDQVQIYGSTESGPTGTVLMQADMARKQGSVGRAMPQCRIDVLDDDGRTVPPGETGEIAITSPATAIGYYRNAAATKEAFDGRRLRTGDVGHMDAEGFVFFTDRKKDIINRGGLKIPSVAVEDVLYGHPSIREAAVVAIPHPELGEDVAACIVLNAGATATEQQLAAYCSDRLAPNAVPRRWLYLSELPKNAMGKILKSELRALMADP
jgi:acyl-CoA synthetase (AMP-forming)/AMP-acid ligase II